MDSLVAPVFKLMDLENLYCTRLEQLGTHMTGRIHSTKLKNRILSYFPDINAHTQGHDVVFVCNKDVSAALWKACEHDTDNDAVHLARVAMIVRRDMLKMKNEFSGSFDAQCQEKSVPVSLLALVSMAQTSQPRPVLHLCLNQLSPSHSYSHTTVWYARARLPP